LPSGYGHQKDGIVFEHQSIFEISLVSPFSWTWSLKTFFTQWLILANRSVMSTYTIG